MGLCMCHTALCWRHDPTEQNIKSKTQDVSLLGAKTSFCVITENTNQNLCSDFESSRKLFSDQRASSNRTIIRFSPAVELVLLLLSGGSDHFHKSTVCCICCYSKHFFGFTSTTMLPHLHTCDDKHLPSLAVADCSAVDADCK